MCVGYSEELYPVRPFLLRIAQRHASAEVITSTGLRYVRLLFFAAVMHRTKKGVKVIEQGTVCSAEELECVIDRKCCEDVRGDIDNE